MFLCRCRLAAALRRLSGNVFPYRCRKSNENSRIWAQPILRFQFAYDGAAMWPASEVRERRTYVSVRVLTPKGTEVLAVGWEEVGRFFEETPFENRQGVMIRHP